MASELGDHADLPSASGCVSVRLLNGGSFTAETGKINEGVENRRFRMYNWAFAIYHERSNRRLVWDLGIADEAELYTPFILDALFPELSPKGPLDSINEQLLRICDWEKESVDTMIFSHAHWDHCRPCSSFLPNAKVYFGPGTAAACSPGHFQDVRSQWDGRFFDESKCTELWSELQGTWVPFGAFEKALDFFGDGSLWIVQAPGHMPGNLCAAARLVSGEYVLLGGDCCHSRDILLGKVDFATFDVNGITMCLHTDAEAARDTLARIRLMEHHHNFHVALAHDSTWLVDERDATLTSIVDEKTLQQARAAIPHDQPF